MIQSRWPFIEFYKAGPFKDELVEKLNWHQKSSFDVILEYYDANGGCGKKICRII